MSVLILSNSVKKILIVSLLHNFQKLSKIEAIAHNYDYIIFNSGLPYQHLSEFKAFIKRYKCAYLVGRHDYLTLKNHNQEIIDWIKNAYNVAIINFNSRNIVILDGGIPLSVKCEDNLSNNLEISFVSYIDNKPWQEYYNGELGYIISNNPISSSDPKYYKNALQIGNKEKTYMVEVDEISIKNISLLE